MSARLVAGVDGGGTKTLVVLADENGRELGRGLAGGSNFQVVGEEAASAALQAAFAAAFASAGVEMSTLAGLCLGLAGVGRPEDRGWVDRFIEERRLADRWRISHDGELLVWAGTPDGWGVGIISGTGSICHGRTPDGREARSGGWGYIFGDEGSGYALVRAALQAVAQAADRRIPPTLLTGRILAAWGLERPTDLVAKVYRGGLGRAEIAALAGLVLDAARDGDATALALREQAERDLTRMAVAVARQLGMEGSIPAALGGGVLVHGAGLAEGLVAQALEEGVRLEPVQKVEEPVRGALRLARVLAQGQ